MSKACVMLMLWGGQTPSSHVGRYILKKKMVYDQYSKGRKICGMWEHVFLGAHSVLQLVFDHLSPASLYSWWDFQSGLVLVLAISGQNM